jgi:hypothetical protein
LSFIDARGPARSFTLAVLGSALTAATMVTAFLGADLTELGAQAVATMFVVALIAAAVVIAFAALLVGLPLTFLLEETRSEEAWIYPAAGLFVGGAITIAFDRFVIGDRLAVPDLLGKMAPFGAVPGGVCGALWWFLYRRHIGPGSAGRWAKTEHKD